MLFLVIVTKILKFNYTLHICCYLLMLITKKMSVNQRTLDEHYFFTRLF